MRGSWTRPKTWTTWRLPSTAQFGRLNLAISPHQRWICFFRRTARGRTPGLFVGVGEYVMVDTRTGAETRVKEGLLQGRQHIWLGIFNRGASIFAMRAAGFCACRRANMAVIVRKVSSLFLVNLESKEVRKLASDTLVLGRWIGESVVITSMGKKSLNPVNIVDIANDKTRELTACGLAVACDPAGRFMIMAGDPKSLGKPARVQECAANHLLAVNLQSKIIKDFGLVDEIPEEVMLSPAGRIHV